MRKRWQEASPSYREVCGALAEMHRQEQLEECARVSEEDFNERTISNSEVDCESSTTTNEDQSSSVERDVRQGMNPAHDVSEPSTETGTA